MEKPPSTVEEIAVQLSGPAAVCVATGGFALAAYALGSAGIGIKRERDAEEDEAHGVKAPRVLSSGAVDVSNRGLDVIDEDLLAVHLDDTKRLTSLDASGNAIKEFPCPKKLMCFWTLTSLNMSGNKLVEIPAEIVHLQALKNLDLGRNCIKHFPREICLLQDLQTLNLMCNDLTELPREIKQLQNLYRLGLKGNKLVSLPPEIGDLVSLKELFLSDNLLTSLPAEMGKLKALVKLQLSWNRLELLPEELATLPNLELMRIAVNRLKKVPLLFVTMPKLAWFSLAGNPASVRLASTKPVASIEKTDFSVLQTYGNLGEGASGDVFLSAFKGNQVAVKVFKSEASPDGQASDEIAIAECLDHPHLTKVVAETKEPRALLLRFESGSPMAKKPNLQSLLTCRWEEGKVFSKAWVLAVASRVASALAHMHSKGVCHGDVYAHNILATESGEAVLCDFGASFFYSGPPYGLWELMEVRAFGLLLRDLLSRLEPDDHLCLMRESKPTSLFAIRDMCLQSVADRRPNFKQILKLMGGVAPLVAMPV